MFSVEGGNRISCPVFNLIFLLMTLTVTQGRSQSLINRKGNCVPITFQSHIKCFWMSRCMQFALMVFKLIVHVLWNGQLIIHVLQNGQHLNSCGHVVNSFRCKSLFTSCGMVSTWFSSWLFMFCGMVSWSFMFCKMVNTWTLVGKSWLLSGASHMIIVCVDRNLCKCVNMQNVNVYTCKFCWCVARREMAPPIRWCTSNNSRNRHVTWSINRLPGEWHYYAWTKVRWLTFRCIICPTRYRFGLKVFLCVVG